jgi:hypothetical protein
MAGAKFDIQFAGELLHGADPDVARARLRKLFNLSDEAAARLFDGNPIVIKRGVDTATASRFREVFRDAGALVRIVPLDNPDEAPWSAQAVIPPSEPTAEAMQREEPYGGTSGLSLAPESQSQPLEADRTANPGMIDTSHLSLVSGDDWSFEDCEPPPPAIGFPDTSHLSLVEPEENKDEDDETGRGRDF